MTAWCSMAQAYFRRTISIQNRNSPVIVSKQRRTKRSGHRIFIDIPQHVSKGPNANIIPDVAEGDRGVGGCAGGGSFGLRLPMRMIAEMNSRLRKPRSRYIMCLDLRNELTPLV